MNREWIYRVRILNGSGDAKVLLVKAKSAVSARRHAALKHVEVTEASFEEINQLGQAGVAIEEAVTFPPVA